MRFLDGAASSIAGTEIATLDFNLRVSCFIA